VIRALSTAAMLGLCTHVSPAQQLAIPPEGGGNVFECFNSDGDGASCSKNQQRSGSWITGDSDGVDDVVLTSEGSVIIPTGSFRKHVIDYSVLFNQGDPGCGAEPIVETPHHAPFVLEFGRYFRTRASYIDYGLTKGWKDNYFFLLNITDQGGYRSARFEVPTGAVMNWIDVGSTGNWSDDNAGLQSMVLSLSDEPGDQHLVTDRWGGKYHFRPDTSTRINLQYVCDWLEDENGNRITITFGSDGFPTQAADGFGRTLVYHWFAQPFNGTKHLASVVLPDGQSIGFQYFFDGLRTYKVTYPNGDVASYGFGDDADGHYYSFNDPLGEPGARKQRVYTYGFGPGFLFDTGRVRGIKDETGHVQLVRHEDASTPRITIEYDDGRGFAYDCAFAGLNETVTNLRTGAVTSNQWQANGGLLKRKIDAHGTWLTADYDDDLALRILRNNLNGSTESWSYGSTNRVVEHVDPNGNTTLFQYDGNGNLLRKTYADGSYEEWTRHASGRVTSYRDREAHLTTYQYDARGNVSAIVLPAAPAQASPVIAFTYDVNGRVLTRVDPVGRVTTYQYDALGRRQLTQHPDGSSEGVTYGSMNPGSTIDPVATAGLVVSRTDRNGHVTNFEFGANDRLVREFGAPGEILYTYDAQDRYLARTENGDVESYGYDGAYRRTSLTRGVGALNQAVTTYAYDLLDRVVSSVDPLGFVSETDYTNNGLVSLRVRQVDSSTTVSEAYTYDANGNVLTFSDGNSRSYVYDSNDRLLRAYDPAPFDANYVEFTYDFEGHTTSRRDQSGHTTFYGYTNRGLPSSEVDPTGVTVLREYNLDDTLYRTLNLGTTGVHTRTYDGGGREASLHMLVDGGAKDITTGQLHDGMGNVVQRVDGEGGVRTFEYDERNRLVRVTDELGKQTVTTYLDDGAPFDARLASGQGSAVSVGDADGHTRTTVHDGLGRVLREIDAAGLATVYTHDVPLGEAFGSLRTDRLGHTWAEYRDGIGRVVFQLDGLAHPTAYVHDLHSNVVRVEDARGNSTTFGYDSLGRRTSVTFPEVADTMSYAYQANGLLSQITDQQGLVTQYTYDGAGRPTSVVYPGGATDTFGYDAGGRLSEATSGEHLNTVTRAYDRADRIVSETTTGQVLIEHDRRSLETRITTPSGRVIENAYTARGELDTVQLGTTVLAQHAYGDSGGLQQRLFGNGTSTTWTYDVNGGVRSILHARGATELLQLTYSRDAEGRKLQQRNLTYVPRSEVYQYDAAGRLVLYRGKLPALRAVPDAPYDPLKGVTRSLAWQLDDVGNWLQVTRNNVTTEQRLHSNANRVTSITGQGGLEYDSRGNLIKDGIYSYAYDRCDRLKEIRELADDELMALYSYDALGRRLTRTAVDKSTITRRRFRYCYAGERVVELHEQPAIGSPDEFFAAFAHGNGLDQPLVMVRENQTLYLHANADSSTTLLTDASGAVRERYEYDPYGRTEVLSGAWAPIGDTSGLGNPFTFHARENDSEASLIFFRGRTLSFVLGRYLQRNPTGHASGRNLYSAASLVNSHSSHGLDD
jgi:YD repeat-containing protein